MFVWFSTGKVTDIHTTTEKDFTQFVTVYAKAQAITFSVRADHSAHILLTCIPGLAEQGASYEIGIGINDDTNTAIFDGASGANLASKTTNNLLGADKFKSFWITWVDGFIKVGKGKLVHKNIIVHYKDKNPTPIHSVAFSGNGAVSDWRIYNMQGQGSICL